MHETFPGVQQMAVDTFLRICQKCRLATMMCSTNSKMNWNTTMQTYTKVGLPFLYIYIILHTVTYLFHILWHYRASQPLRCAGKKKFVVQQSQEPAPFIETIPQHIAQDISELEHLQICTFFEAVGHLGCVARRAKGAPQNFPVSQIYGHGPPRHMISAAHVEQKGRLISLNLALFNEKWQSILQGFWINFSHRFFRLFRSLSFFYFHLIASLPSDCALSPINIEVSEWAGRHSKVCPPRARLRTSCRTTRSCGKSRWF